MSSCIITIDNKSIKYSDQLLFQRLLSYNLYSINRQSFHLKFSLITLFQLNRLKIWQEKFFVHILRLLAGKFGPICIEYPLATFWAKILTRLPSKNFPLKNTASRAKNRKVKANLSSLRKKNHYTVNNSMLFL